MHKRLSLVVLLLSASLCGMENHSVLNDSAGWLRKVVTDLLASKKQACAESSQPDGTQKSEATKVSKPPAPEKKNPNLVSATEVYFDTPCGRGGVVAPSCGAYPYVRYGCGGLFP